MPSARQQTVKAQDQVRAQPQGPERRFDAERLRQVRRRKQGGGLGAGDGGSSGRQAQLLRAKKSRRS